MVIFQNVFSPKAAGWTQPLAFGNHENVENHEFPRFGNFPKRDGPDPRAKKWRTAFPLISVLSNLSQLPYAAICFCGTTFPNIFPELILGPIRFSFGPRGEMFQYLLKPLLVLQT